MNRVAYISVLFLMLLGAFTPLSAQVTSAVDTTSIRIGEQVTYTISVAADSIKTVTFPEQQTFLPLEVIEFYPTDTLTENAKTTLVKKYGLTQFDSGRYTIPRQRVLIGDKLFLTDSVLVEVADVVVDTTSQKMFDIKSPIAVKEPPSKVWRVLSWVFIVLLIVAAVIYFFWWGKQKIKEAKQQLPPYEEALSALQNLDNSEFLKNKQIKDYYSSLTEIVKRYLDREVDETALESTTDELIDRLRLLKDSGKLDFDKETIQGLDTILRRADLIKFAKMNTETGQAQADRSSIENIINQTHEAIPEPTEEELLRDEMYRREIEARKRRQRRKKWAGITAISVVVLIVVSGIIFGFNTLRDIVFGNQTKTWAETEWIRSMYGNPAIVMETPEVLVRADSTLISKALPIITQDDVFLLGDVQDALFVLASSTPLPEGANPELQNVLDQQLTLLENKGATNMIVKDEPFTTENNVKGLRAFGEFNVKVGKNKYKKDKSEFEVLIFAQSGGLQEVIIVNEKEDLYAQQIKERILRTIEIELTQKKQ